MAAAAPAAPADAGRAFYKVQVNREIYEIDTRYQKLKYISAGAYGMVCSAEDSVLGRKVAIKKIKGTFRDLTDAKRILREILLLKHLKAHENVIWILDVMTSPQGTRNFQDVYIVTDLMETDLFRIIDSPQALTDSHIKYFTYQILRGLKYVHSAGVLHRDLKPQNLLVNSNCELVVADFGLARAVKLGEGASRDGADDDTEGEGACAMAKARAGSGSGGGGGGGAGEDLTQYVVTRWYRAPELLVGCRSYTEAIDVWSVGCILAELLGRRPLLPGRDYADQLKLTVQVLGTPADEQLWFVTSASALAAIRSVGKRPRANWAKLFPTANPLAHDLLDKMLQFDPAKRITVVEALAHPYLSDYACTEDEPMAAPIAPEAWEFDRRGHLTKTELQSLMMAEMAAFRPSVGSVRPQSTRMAAHSRAAVAAIPSGPAAAAVAAATGTGARSSASAAATGVVASAATAAPARTSLGGAGSAAPAAAAAVATKATATAAAAAPAATVAAPAVPPKPAQPPPAAPPRAAEHRSSASASTAAAPAAAAPAATAASVVIQPPNGISADLTLVAALMEQMRGLRSDLLSAMDTRLTAVEANVAAKVEAQVAARMAPLMDRIAKLEASAAPQPPAEQ